jgi:hypothetical protein
MRQEKEEEAMSRRLRIALAAATVALAMVAAPTPAHAWKYVFQDFFAASGSGATGSKTVAKKCKGGKTGYYKLVGNAASITGSFEIEIHLKADLPVFPKFQQLRNVDFSLDVTGSNLPPNYEAELLNAYGNFYETLFAQYVAKKDKIIFRHQGIVLFGQQVLEPGEHAEPFKPKQGC